MTQPGDAAQADDGLALDMVAAALRADSSDIAIYAQVLTESLGDACLTGCGIGQAPSRESPFGSARRP